MGALPVEREFDMYFNQATCSSVKDVMRQYKLLTFLYHPDKGGDVRTMQDINAEYEALKARFKSGGSGYSSYGSYTSASQSARSSSGAKSEKLTRDIGNISNVTQADLDWLIAGSSISGNHVSNKRKIMYTTKRGVLKMAICFVLSSGKHEWRTCTMDSAGWKRGLTDEEARHFEPELWKQRQERKAERKKRNASTGRAFEVGDVVGTCWGYEARLYNFYEVVRVSATGKTVWVRELNTEQRPGINPNHWRVRPIRHSYCGKEQKHLVQWYFEEPYLNMGAAEGHAGKVTDFEKWRDCDDYH
jgi:curved DNA-binding protein CbpA